MSPTVRRIIAKFHEAKSGGSKERVPFGHLVIKNTPGTFYDQADTIAASLASVGYAKVYDPQGIILSTDLKDYIIDALVTVIDRLEQSYHDLRGGGYRDDSFEDDPDDDMETRKMKKAFHKAMDEMGRAKVVVHGNKVTTVPSYLDVKRKYGLIDVNERRFRF